MKAIWLPGVAVIGLAMAGAAQEGVMIGHDLSEEAAEGTKVFLAGSLPDLSIHLSEVGGKDLVKITTSLERPDLLLGVEDFTCRRLAKIGLLVARSSSEAAHLAPRFRPSDGRFVVPLLSPITLAFNQTWTWESAPADYDDLLWKEEYLDELILCEPQAMPGLWVGMIQRQHRLGHGDEMAFTWLCTLDARVSGYRSGTEDLLSTLQAGAEGSLAFLPYAELVAGSPGVSFRIPSSGMPVRGLGLALVSQDAGVRPAAERVFDALASREYALAISKSAHLVPAPRDDLPIDELSESVRLARTRLMPYDLAAAHPQRWFQRWRDDVEGWGRYYVDFDTVFYIIGSIGFLIFAFFVYRHLEVTEKNG